MQAHKKPNLKPLNDLESLDSRIAHLKGVPLFSDISAHDNALMHLAEILDFQVFEPGTSIIQEGEAGSELYLLVDGQASIYKATIEGEPYKVAILDSKQKAFFGEGGLLESEARSATIKADTLCHCLVLRRSAFEDFAGRHPNWALPILLRIARAVLDRLRRANNDLSLLYHALVAEIRGH